MQIERTNTILYCQKWLETVDFYRNILAFPITYQNDWFVEFQLTAHAYLSIADESRATIHSVSGQGITLSWQVLHLNEMRAALLKQNIAVSPIRPKWGASLFYLHDPEGHRIELWQPSGA
jgi:catechol 2,3-dioxygenase-like lactoylglutathione lyase family enzyme